MWIFGYNEKKQVIEVDVSLEAVLSLGIDPWRLDLFDPNPVEHEVAPGEKLFFRRLDDVAFAYTWLKTAYVCMHDGQHTVCLQSDSGLKRTDRIVGMKDFRASKKPFTDHLRQFLLMGGRTPNEATVWVEKACAHPRTADCVRFANGGTVELTDLGSGNFYTDRAEFPRFVGEMFRAVPVRFAMPPDINWMFETFGHLEPLIHGETLWRPMTGREPINVRFALKSARRSEFESIARGLALKDFKVGSDRQMQFYHADRFYWEWLAEPSRVLQAIAAPGFFYSIVQSSLNHVYATGVNQVYASRIALHDIARRRVRAVSHGAHVEAATLDRWSRTKLEIPRGWTIESIVFRNKKLDRHRITELIERGELVDGPKPGDDVLSEPSIRTLAA